MAQTLTKHEDEDWDFRTANTKEFTHCFHAYPARMVPQLARTLLQQYGVKDGWLLDPYCGSGTSLVEASLFGMNALGCDVNPLARLIATAKTSTLSLQSLNLSIKDFSDRLSEIEYSGLMPDAEPIRFPNQDYWFAPEVTHKLALLHKHIGEIEDEAIANFFRVAFAETVRECSYTRNSEFKLFRMPMAQMGTFKPDVFKSFCAKLERNRQGLTNYLLERRPVRIILEEANLSEKQTPAQTPSQGFELVLTSPPYGDSGTTVAYGQFSRLAAEWLDMPGARTIDRRTMGGKTTTGDRDLGSITEPLSDIINSDSKRGQQVAAFYNDLANSIDTIVTLLARRATVCYIVGNRRVKGVTLPTDKFIVDEFTRHGLHHKKTLVRNIPNKRMPARNSPSNITGATDVTMTKEYIVICQR